MSIEQSYNFQKLNDQFTTSGVVATETLRHLGEEGYELVVNLVPEDNEYFVADEKSIVESQGIRYVHIPVIFTEPKQAELDQFLDLINGIKNQKVHVHCAANWRVSAFYGIACVLNGSWTPAQARAFITAIWNPIEHPAWCRLLQKYGIDIE